MTTLRMGELFAGYGGLGMGVADVLDVELAWVSEFDKGPSKILEHRFPGVPNHGDITKIDWSQVEPVDVLTGGSPCQDLSHAGKRAGMTDGTRSNLWVAMREAIAALRPSLVVWENVRGAYSAEADSELVNDPRLLADTRRRDGEPVLRALGRVLGDLSDLGYDAAWCGLRAADVGAAHGRFRVFVLAWPAADSTGRHLDNIAAREAGPPSNLHRTNTDGTKGGPNQRGSSGDLMLPSAVAGLMLPTPTSRDWKDHTIRREPHWPDDVDTLARALTDVPCALLPTPACNDMGAAYTPDEWDAWTERMKAEHGNGNGHGKSLAIEAQKLLPTPRAEEPGRTSENYGDCLADAVGITGKRDRWGKYAAAIARWEAILGRPAPAPTQTSAKGNPQLSARFTEWMMGLPDGWITDVPGITRNEALKACGNGVVPQQAAEALRWLLAVTEAAA